MFILYQCMFLMLTGASPLCHAFVLSSPCRNCPCFLASSSSRGEGGGASDTGGTSEPTREQLDALHKYGPTPETSMEIFFDQLMTEGGDKEFLEQTGADAQAQEKWQTFLSNMKQVKKADSHDDDDNTPQPPTTTAY